jgi:general secretion pathway protein G
MSRQNSRNGFTLIEVLIVVIIMAVLAATIIPQFSYSTDDAKQSALKFDVRTMRSQIELYKLHHNGLTPTLAQIETQLTGKTDADGTPNPAGAYGPYIEGELPTNPYDGSNAVSAAVGNPPATDNGNGGWQYDEATGRIYPNHPGWTP